jgi:hypothetical protein
VSTEFPELKAILAPTLDAMAIGLQGAADACTSFRALHDVLKAPAPANVAHRVVALHALVSIARTRVADAPGLTESQRHVLTRELIAAGRVLAALDPTTVGE